MLNKKYDVWMNGFMESWKKLEGEKTTEWLAPDVKYYENPDDEPCAAFGKIIELWKIVPENQKDIEYTYQIICADESFCVINWKMDRTIISLDKDVRQHINGIFQIAVNDYNKCTFFKQWRSTTTL